MVGDIADILAAKAPPTAFELGTRRFGFLIMRLTVLLVLFVLIINAVLHRPWLESFLFAVALAVLAIVLMPGPKWWADRLLVAAAALLGWLPVLGWITVDVSDRVAAAGMLLRLSVRPREPGELPVIFAGPLGALIARNGTVVAAPAAREVAR